MGTTPITAMNALGTHGSVTLGPLTLRASFYPENRDDLERENFSTGDA